MGYAHGTQWNEELIIKGIREVVDFLEINRMPSKSEIESYYGNSALTNKIAKTGGFYQYAEQLGLDIKESESKLGIKFEKKVTQLLEELGFSVKHTSTKHPYDILVNGRVKIDVKVANISQVRGSKVYSFNLERDVHSCDLYIAIALNGDKEVNKIYVIPASIMNGKKQLTVGMVKSKYNKYLNRWDFIDKINESLAELEAV